MRSPRSVSLCLAAFLAIPALSPPPGLAQTTPSVAPDKAPAAVYIIRHAEKPAAEENSPDLAPAGFKRAQALPALFAQAPGAPAPRLHTPDVIFATARSKNSNRPVETVTPLAGALNLPIQHDFQDKDTAGIAGEVLSGKFAGKTVLICWHHGQIPNLAAALGVSDAPAKWDDTVFNQVWKMEYSGGKVKFSTLNEGVLPGDLP